VKRKPASPPSQVATEIATAISAQLFGKHFIQRVEEIAEVIERELARIARSTSTTEGRQP